MARGVADSLKKEAFFMAIDGQNAFKVRAFKHAADLIQKDSALFQKCIAKRDFTEFAGIGKNISLAINEILIQGKSANLIQLNLAYPESLWNLKAVEGIGPSKILLLFQTLGITTLGELEYACRENRLALLKGFGAKTQEKVLNSISFLSKHESYYLHSHAAKVAKELVVKMGHVVNVVDIAIVGELGRFNETVQSIDIGIATDRLEKVSAEVQQLFSHCSDVKNIPYAFSTVWESIPVHVYFYAVNKREIAEWILTSHPTHIQQVADLLPINLENYDLAHLMDVLTEKYTSIEKLYQGAGLAVFPPELRDQHISVTQVKNDHIKSLLSLDDIKGLIHVHSTYSDGANSMEEMCLAAINRGFQYIVFTEHSQSATYAGGLDSAKIAQQRAEIETLKRQYHKHLDIYFGIESDIKADGALDYVESTLKQFDFVIASIHGARSNKAKENTSRMLTALKNVHTRMIGHPSGRLLLARDGYPLEIEKIVETSIALNKPIEFNAQHRRLDLPWQTCFNYHDQGLKVVISPDAHCVEDINNLDFGVRLMRKALISKNQVINTMDREAFKAYLNLN